MSERELFTAVLQIADREERLAYLEKNCPGEEARRRLAELLAAHEALQETQAPRPEAFARSGRLTMRSPGEAPDGT